MIEQDYQREVCGECGQFKTYLLALDRGTATIVKAVAAAIRNKGTNIIHPTKEMEVPAAEWTYERAVHAGVLTSMQIGNLTRARVHGLLARVKGEPGNWCLTTKGARFLRGEAVPRFAIIRKSRRGDGSHKEEYFEPERYTITVQELGREHETWVAIDYEIIEGRVVRDAPAASQETKAEAQAATLF